MNEKSVKPDKKAFRDISEKSALSLIHEIEALPEDQQKIVEAVFTAMSIRQSYSGPLPPPEILAKYNEAVPNAAERILKLAEDQAHHRMALEKETIKEQQRQGSKGQTLGFVIGITGLLIAGFCAYIGHGVVGGVVASIDLIGLVGIFVLGKYRQDKDLEVKE